MGRRGAEPQGSIIIVGADYLRTVGDRIASNLEAFGMTQAELASDLEVSEATVSRWVNGLCEPRRYHKQAIADTFGTKVHRLFAEQA